MDGSQNDASGLSSLLVLGVALWWWIVGVPTEWSRDVDRSADAGMSGTSSARRLAAWFLVGIAVAVLSILLIGSAQSSAWALLSIVAVLLGGAVLLFRRAEP